MNKKTKKENFFKRSFKKILNFRKGLISEMAYGLASNLVKNTNLELDKAREDLVRGILMHTKLADKGGNNLDLTVGKLRSLIGKEAAYKKFHAKYDVVSSGFFHGDVELTYERVNAYKEKVQERSRIAKRKRQVFFVGLMTLVPFVLTQALGAFDTTYQLLYQLLLFLAWLFVGMVANTIARKLIVLSRKEAYLCHWREIYIERLYPAYTTQDANLKRRAMLDEKGQRKPRDVNSSETHMYRVVIFMITMAYFALMVGYSIIYGVMIAEAWT